MRSSSLGAGKTETRVSNGQFEIARGSHTQADAVLETDPATLTALVYQGRNLDETLRSGEVKLTGDKIAVKRFLKLFPLPETSTA
jgi:ubiquinone biosynthesis protein UbiJ